MPSMPGIDRSHSITSVASPSLSSASSPERAVSTSRRPSSATRMASERHMFGSSSTTSTRGRTGDDWPCDIIDATAGCPS